MILKCFKSSRKVVQDSLALPIMEKISTNCDYVANGKTHRLLESKYKCEALATADAKSQSSWESKHKCGVKQLLCNAKHLKIKMELLSVIGNFVRTQ